MNQNVNASWIKVPRVLLVDDHEIVRTGLRLFLARNSVEVVGECSTASAALEHALRLLPDVVLLDVSLPDKSGIDVCVDILRVLPKVRILILTGSEDTATQYGAMYAGAHGYLPKTGRMDELIPAIRAVLAGQLVFDSQHRPSVRRPPINQPSGSITTLLSPRQYELLALVAEGKTNKQIAAVLGISDKTVKNYLSEIFVKLKVDRRSEAAAIFARSEFGG